jgi:hypothetical protein
VKLIKGMLNVHNSYRFVFPFLFLTLSMSDPVISHPFFVDGATGCHYSRNSHGHWVPVARPTSASESDTPQAVIAPCPAML